MRNLKRALSLTLASVMLLGMMVVGTSAAVGYDDVKETDNVEAIEVLQAIEVMVGDERGFGPDRPVNRAEMAVVMGKLLNLDYNYYESACPFTDVSGNYAWARGWVGAAYANKILSGRSATVFDPGATVTAVEAASMMMRALGYFQYAEDVADGFQLATVRQGSEIGIFNGVGTDGNTAMTRNQVAQMALNALQADMVRFTGTPGIDVNGVKVGYKAEYTPRTSTDPKYNRLIDNKHSSNIDYSGQYYVQLGEELYNGDLTKRYVTDDFERPSFNWQFKGKEIGTYVNYSIREAEYTEAVKYSELYDLLTYTTIDENDLDRFVDGVDQSQNKSDFRRSNKNEVGGQGVLTEVFVDRDREQITITSINTYLAQANSDYNATNETLSLKVYETSATGVTKIVDVKDVPKIEGVKKDEYKLVYLSGKDNNSATNKVVSKIYDTEILAEASITKWSNANAPKVVDKLTVDGTEYKSNPKAFYDDGNVLDNYDLQLLTDNTYNIYMDRYGNVIGVDLFEGSKNYVFIAGYDRGASHISVKTADAAAIFMDGTMDVITVNVTDTNKNIKAARAEKNSSGILTGAYYEYEEWGSTTKTQSGDTNLNRWYTYTVASNGTYTLKPVKNFVYTSYSITPGSPKTLDCANLYLDDSSALTSKGRVYGEDASVYITVDVDNVDYTPTDGQGITDVKGVYTGAQDVKIDLEPVYLGTVNQDKTGSTAQEHANERNAYVYTVFDNDGFVIASVVLGEAQGAAGSYGYILGPAKSERIERESSGTRAAGDVTYYWEFEAVYEGEKTTLQAKTKYPSSTMLNPFTVQELRFDGEYVSDVKTIDVAKIQTTNKDNTKLADMKVYDVGQKDGVVWSTNNGNGTSYLDNTDATLTNTTYYSGNPNARIGEAATATIYLQGRTLYTRESGVQDIGLGLARDAKAVTIQMEDGKREVINHASVDDAIARLADRDPDTDGVQFKGRIVAVLDSRGVAQWVVLISDTELLTGNNPNYNKNGNLETKLPGSRGNIVYSVSDFNGISLLNATVTYTAPEYATALTGVTMPAIDVYDGDIKLGTLLAPAKNTINSNGVASFSYSSTTFQFFNLAGKSLTFKLAGSEKLDSVRVKYVDAADTSKTVPVTTASTKDITVGNLAANTDIKIKVDQSKNTYASAKITDIDGITLTGSAAIDKSNDMNDSSEKAAFTTYSGASVDGNAYVTVKIALGAATPVPNAYDVTANGAASYTATLGAIGVTGLPSADSKGKNVVLKVTPTAASIGDTDDAEWTIQLIQSGGGIDGVDGLVIGYKVYFSINGVPQTERTLDFKGAGSVSATVTKMTPKADQDLVITAVEAVRISNPYAMSATLSDNGKILTVTYSEALSEETADVVLTQVRQNGTALVVGTDAILVNGNVVRITLDTGLNDGERVTIDSGAIKSLRGGLAAKTAVIYARAKAAPATGFNCEINNNT